MRARTPLTAGLPERARERVRAVGEEKDEPAHLGIQGVGSQVRSAALGEGRRPPASALVSPPV